MGLPRWLDRIVRGRRDQSRRRRSLALVATICALETRETPAITSFTATAIPTVLSPPNNQYQSVIVTGTFRESRNHAPSLNFTVVDAYRRDQPSKMIQPVTLDGHKYVYAFQVFLQARRTANDIPGRQYAIVVAAGDEDGSTGKVLGILVPHNLSTVSATATRRR